MQPELHTCSPQSLIEELQSHLKKNQLQVEITSKNSSEIHDFYQKKKIDKGISLEDLSGKIGLQDNGIQEFNSFFINLFKVRNKLLTLCQKKNLVPSQISNAQIWEDKMLKISTARPLLNDVQFCNNLTYKFSGMRIQSQAEFIRALNLQIEALQYKDFEQSGFEIIKKYLPESQNFGSSDKQKVVQEIYKRIQAANDSITQMIQLDFEQDQDWISIINFLFNTEIQGSFNGESSKSKQQSQAQFVSRVKSLICQKSAQLKNKQIPEDIEQKFYLDLFQARSHLNYQKIEAIFKGIKLKEFIRKKIPKQLICSIYQLQSESDLDLEKLNPQNLESSKLSKIKQQGLQKIEKKQSGHQANNCSDDSIQKDNHSKVGKSESKKSVSKIQKQIIAKQQLSSPIFQIKKQGGESEKEREKESESEKISSSYIQEEYDETKDKSDKSKMSEQSKMKQKIREMNGYIQRIKKNVPENLENELIEYQLTVLCVSLMQKKQNKVQECLKNMENLMKKYDVQSTFIERLKVIKPKATEWETRYSAALRLKKDFEILNLTEIQIERQEIERQSKTSKLENCQLHVGMTGNGKTTTMTGMAGQQIIEIDNGYKKVYIAANEEFAKEHRVSDAMISCTKTPSIVPVNPSYLEQEDEGLQNVDLAGAEDTRSQQVDITNNIASEMIIKKIKRARILVYIGKGLEENRGILLVKLAEWLENYILDLEKQGNYIYFILTKGITTNELLGAVKSLLAPEQKKGRKFFKILKQWIEESLNDNKKKPWEIHNPATHSYQKLVKDIAARCSELKLPGLAMRASYSKESNNEILRKKMDLDRTCRKFYEMGESQIWKCVYYLKQLRFLQEDIEKAGGQVYSDLIQYLKKSTNNKLAQYQKQILKFVKTNNEMALTMSNQTLMVIKGSCSLEKFLFDEDKYQSPSFKAEKFLQKILDDGEAEIRNSKNSKASLEEMRAYAKLLEINRFELYQELIGVQKKKKIDSENRIIELTLMDKPDSEEWKLAVQAYLSHFDFENKTTQLENQQIICKLISQKMEESKIEIRIQNFLNDGRANGYSGQLEQIVSPYMKKIQLFKNSLPGLKKEVDERKKECLEMLKTEVDLYNQMIDSLKDGEEKMVDINIIKDNVLEISPILQTNSNVSCSSLGRDTSFIKKLIRMLKLNVEVGIQELQILFKDAIRDLPQKPISLKKFKKKISYIIMNRQQLCEMKLKNTSSCDRILKQAVEQAKNAVKQFLKTSHVAIKNGQIRNFELNYKLLAYLFVFSETKQLLACEQYDIQKTCKQIQKKMLSPLENMVSINFQNSSDFEKLHKLMIYLRNLELKQTEHQQNAKFFEEFIHYRNDKSLIEILEKAYKYFETQKIQKFQQLQEGQEEQGNLEKSTIKVDHKNKELAINYIECFDNLLKTFQEFHNEGIDFIEANFQSLEKRNLERIIKGRLNSLWNKIDQQKEIDLTQMVMKGIQRNVRSLMNILEKSNKQKSHDQFIQLREKVKQLIRKLGQNWNKVFQNTQNQYANLKQTGQSFDSLEELRKLPGSRVESNKKLLLGLYRNIDKQIQKILKTLFSQIGKYDINQKVSAYESIFSFKESCNQIQYKYDFKDNILIENCHEIFRDFKKSLDKNLKDIKKGIFKQSEFRNLQRVQKRIQAYLNKEYTDFLNKEQIKKPLFSDFLDRKQKIEEQFQSKYINPKTFIVDAELTRLYQSLENQKVKNQITSSYNQVTSEKIKKSSDSLNVDHRQFETLFNQLTAHLRESPKDLADGFKNQLKNLQKSKGAIETQILTDGIDKLTRKDFDGVIDQMQKAKSINSDTLFNEINTKLKDSLLEICQNIDFNSKQNFSDSISKISGLDRSSKFKTLSKQLPIIKRDCQEVVRKIKDKINSKIQHIIDNMNTQGQSAVNKAILKCKTDKLPMSDTVFQKIQGINILINIYEATLNSILDDQNTSAKIAIQNLNKQINQKIENSISFYEKLQRNLEGAANQSDAISNTNPSIDQLTTSTIVDSQIMGNIFNRHLAEQAKQFNRLQGMMQKLNQENLIKADQNVEKLKKTIQQGFRKVDSWKIKKSFVKDTELRIRSNLKTLQMTIKSVDMYAPFFFNQTQIPHNALQKIRKDFTKQYQEWSSQIEKMINEAYNKSNDYQLMKSFKNYHMIYRMFQNNRPDLFPQDSNCQKKIFDLLHDKHKQNERSLISFYTDIDNQKKFQYFNNELKKIKDKIQQEKNIAALQIKQKQNQIQNQQNKLLQNQINKIPTSGEQRKKEQEAIRNKYEGNKHSKKKDFNTESQKKMLKYIESTEKQKSQINESLRSWAQKGFVHFLIVSRQAQAYFDCDQFRKIQGRLGQLIKQHLRVVEKKYGKRLIKEIYSILVEDQNNFSKFLISQHQVFERFKGGKFSQQTNGKTFSSLLSEMASFKNKQGKQMLLLRYKRYNDIYEKLLRRYQDSRNYDNCQREIIDKCKQLAANVQKSYQDHKAKCNREELIANIFAIWTITTADKDDGVVTFRFQPHAGQVLAVFLLLEFENSENSMPISKAMIQVSTGQGKSVILGVICTYLALAGFEVYQACFSKYLSERDYSLFKDIFTCLKIHNNVHYDIFPEICKMKLNGCSNNSFTDKVKDYIQEYQITNKLCNIFRNTNKKQEEIKKSILVIDEADVFINEEFLGQNYFPMIQFKSDKYSSIINLLDRLWQQRAKAKDLTVQKVIKLKQFQAVCKELGNNSILSNILKNQVNDMIRGLIRFNDDRSQRTVKDDRIFYKQGDGLSDKVHFGYRTVFAYYYEHHLNNSISYGSFKQQVFIGLIAASFSYSYLPKLFKSILGVSGTLKAMSDPQRSFLTEEYEVKRQFVLQSIYPPSNRSIKFQKVSNLSLYRVLAQSAKKQSERGRPVIIFFKTKHQLYNFFNSPLFEQPEFDQLKIKMNLVTYEIDPNQRDFRIETSTFDSTITLMTDDFGRGTDFRIYSSDKQHQGLHVISTSLPESYCDYEQLCGRVGRQGKKGTVEINIVEESKSQSQQQTNIVKQVSQQEGENLIRQKDKEKWNLKSQSIKQRIRLSIKNHEKSRDVYQNTSDKTLILNHIFQLNEVPLLTKRKTKTIIMVDGTGSMGRTFSIIADVIKKSMPRIKQIVKNKTEGADMEVQICIYRNYNSPSDQLIQSSSFELDYEPIVRFISKMRVSGGWGNQAVEVALQHANKQNQLDQLIIVADAPGNSKQETISKRNHSFKWPFNRNFPETDWQTEVKKLADKKVKIHSFYINRGNTERYFCQVSKQTGGTAAYFDVTSSQAEVLFTNFISERILQNLGEKTGNTDLVTQYRKKYTN